MGCVGPEFDSRRSHFDEVEREYAARSAAVVPLILRGAFSRRANSLWTTSVASVASLPMRHSSWSEAERRCSTLGGPIFCCEYPTSSGPSRHVRRSASHTNTSECETRHERSEVTAAPFPAAEQKRIESSIDRALRPSSASNGSLRESAATGMRMDTT